MTDTIENEYLSISILRKGVELSSLKSKKTGIEYLWQANPEIWGSHAPILFPVIGALKEGAFTYKGELYQGMPKHGFIRRNEGLMLAEQRSDYVRYELNYTPDTFNIYPFKFGFSIAYKLVSNQLRVEHEVINQGYEPMLFSLGGHPAFNCPRRSERNMRIIIFNLKKRKRIIPGN